MAVAGAGAEGGPQPVARGAGEQGGAGAGGVGEEGAVADGCGGEHQGEFGRPQGGQVGGEGGDGGVRREQARTRDAVRQRRVESAEPAGGLVVDHQRAQCADRSGHRRVAGDHQDPGDGRAGERGGDGVQGEGQREFGPARPRVRCEPALGHLQGFDRQYQGPVRYGRGPRTGPGRGGCGRERPGGAYGVLGHRRHCGAASRGLASAAVLADVRLLTCPRLSGRSARQPVRPRVRLVRAERRRSAPTRSRQCRSGIARWQCRSGGAGCGTGPVSRAGAGLG